MSCISGLFLFPMVLQQAWLQSLFLQPLGNKGKHCRAFLLLSSGQSLQFRTWHSQLCHLAKDLKIYAKIPLYEHSLDTEKAMKQEFFAVTQNAMRTCNNNTFPMKITIYQHSAKEHMYPKRLGEKFRFGTTSCQKV